MKRGSRKPISQMYIVSSHSVLSIWLSSFATTISSSKSVWLDVLKGSGWSASRGVGDWWIRWHQRCLRDQSPPTTDVSTSKLNRCSQCYLGQQRLATLHKTSSGMRMMGGWANEEHRALTGGTSDGSGDVISSPAAPTRRFRLGR
jgi:hypothetical protein